MTYQKPGERWRVTDVYEGEISDVTTEYVVFKDGGVVRALAAPVPGMTRTWEHVGDPEPATPGTIVIDPNGDAWQRDTENDTWWAAGSESDSYWEAIPKPARVVHVPGRAA